MESQTAIAEFFYENVLPTVTLNGSIQTVLNCYFIQLFPSFRGTEPSRGDTKQTRAEYSHVTIHGRDQTFRQSHFQNKEICLVMNEYVDLQILIDIISSHFHLLVPALHRGILKF
jgi:hypothetical protein